MCTDVYSIHNPSQKQLSKAQPVHLGTNSLQGAMLRSKEELSRRRKSKTKTAEAICAMERANKNESSST